MEVEAKEKTRPAAAASGNVSSGSIRSLHGPMEIEVEAQEGPAAVVGNVFSGCKRRKVLEMIERIRSQSEDESHESIQNQLSVSLWGSFSHSVCWPSECREMMSSVATRYTKENLNDLVASGHRCTRASKAVASLEATVPKLQELMNKMRKQMSEDTAEKAPKMALDMLKAQGLLDGIHGEDLKYLQMRWMREPRLTSPVPVNKTCETLVGFMKRFIEKLGPRRDKQLLFVQVLLNADLGRSQMFLSERPHASASLEQLEQELHAEWGHRINYALSQA